MVSMIVVAFCKQHDVFIMSSVSLFPSVTNQVIEASQLVYFLRVMCVKKSLFKSIISEISTRVSQSSQATELVLKEPLLTRLILIFLQ